MHCTRLMVMAFSVTCAAGCSINMIKDPFVHRHEKDVFAVMNEVSVMNSRIISLSVYIEDFGQMIGLTLK